MGLFLQICISKRLQATIDHYDADKNAEDCCAAAKPHQDKAASHSLAFALIWIGIFGCHSAPNILTFTKSKPSAPLTVPIKMNVAPTNSRTVKKNNKLGAEMATPAGLEPATYCLEGSCSIQLS